MATSTVEWPTRVGDLGRAFTGTVTLNGAAVNLTGKSVKIRLRFKGAATLKVDAVATITDAPNGRISYSPIAGDLDTAGTLYGAIVVDQGLSTQISAPTEVDLVWHVRPAA